MKQIMGIIRSEGLDAEYYTEERCYIQEIINRPALEGVSIAKARVEPGVHTALHKLKETDELYYILEGQGQIEVDQVMLGQVKEGDSVLIRKGQSQRILNIGEQDLIFLCICQPRFRPEAYIHLE